MLDPRRKAPQIKWKDNKNHGIILCLLFRFFEKDNNAFERIFSAIFDKELKEYGFESGVLFHRLNAQWMTMRNGEHSVWLEVHVRTPFERHGLWSDFLCLIQGTAESLGIDLKYNEGDIHASEFHLRSIGHISPVS